METYMNLSNEDRMLLYCSQTEIPEALRSRIKNLLSSPMNWDQLLESAYWHGVAPLLYHNLKQIGEGSDIPAGLMLELKDAYYKNLAKNIYLYAELQRILEEFNENGIKVIVLKGAALAKSAYGNIALRPMSDIDLMIKKENLPGAEKIMSDLGYAFNGKESPEWYRENYYHIGYLSPDKVVLVEVHWHIARKSHPSRIAVTDSSIIEGWWERAQTVEISGKKALALCADDLLLHLSLHFFKHRFSGTFTNRNALIQLCDISQILKHHSNEVNWDRLKRESDKYGVASIVHSTLYLAQKLLGGSKPTSGDISNGLGPENFDNDLVGLIEKRIMLKGDNIPSGFVQSLTADSFQMKLRTLLSSLFPSPVVLAKRYSLDTHSLKLYLYYLMRPLSILLRHGNLLWKFWRSNKEIKEEIILSKWINSKN